MLVDIALCATLFNITCPDNVSVSVSISVVVTFLLTALLTTLLFVCGIVIRSHQTRTGCVKQILTRAYSYIASWLLLAKHCTALGRD